MLVKGNLDSQLGLNWAQISAVDLWEVLVRKARYFEPASVDIGIPLRSRVHPLPNNSSS